MTTIHQSVTLIINRVYFWISTRWYRKDAPWPGAKNERHSWNFGLKVIYLNSDVLDPFPHFTGHVITYHLLGLKLVYLVKWASGGHPHAPITKEPWKFGWIISGLVQVLFVRNGLESVRCCQRRSDFGLVLALWHSMYWVDREVAMYCPVKEQIFQICPTRDVFIMWNIPQYILNIYLLTRLTPEYSTTKQFLSNWFVNERLRR